MRDRDTRRLTDGGLHNHGVRVTGAQAVSSSVDRLHSKHIVCSSDQAVAHKPAGSEGEHFHPSPFTNICDSNNGNYKRNVLFVLHKSVEKWRKPEK